MADSIRNIAGVKDLWGAMKQLLKPPASGEGNERSDLKRRAARVAEQPHDGDCRKHCQPLYEVILLLKEKRGGFAKLSKWRMRTNVSPSHFGHFRSEASSKP